MPSQLFENSNVLLWVDVEPLPVSSNRYARHRFEVTNHNDWTAEITDSVVVVVSTKGLVLIPPNGGGQGITWSPGRLGALEKNESTVIIETEVRKDTKSWSAGEDVKVQITFQRTPGKKNRVDLPSQAVQFPALMHVTIK